MALFLLLNSAWPSAHAIWWGTLRCSSTALQTLRSSLQQQQQQRRHRLHRKAGWCMPTAAALMLFLVSALTSAVQLPQPVAWLQLGTPLGSLRYLSSQKHLPPSAERWRPRACVAFLSFSGSRCLHSAHALAVSQRTGRHTCLRLCGWPAAFSRSLLTPGPPRAPLLQSARPASAPAALGKGRAGLPRRQERAGQGARFQGQSLPGLSLLLWRPRVTSVAFSTTACSASLHRACRR